MRPLTPFARTWLCVLEIAAGLSLSYHFPGAALTIALVTLQVLVDPAFRKREGP